MNPGRKQLYPLRKAKGIELKKQFTVHDGTASLQTEGDKNWLFVTHSRDWKDSESVVIKYFCAQTGAWEEAKQ